MNKLSAILIFILFQINFSFAKHIYPEKVYQKNWCDANYGIMEYKLTDDTRVDCLTKDYAVEFDFAPKWAEAIGQSLHYSRMTGKKAGINLIIEQPEDFKYYNRIVPLCEMYNITLWYSKAQDISPDKTTNSINMNYIYNLIIKFINFILSLF